MKLRRLTSVILMLAITFSLFGVFASAANPFVDVPEKEFYYEPVMWAIDNDITQGTSATTFSPAETCTRGQVVTFLWRAFGKPEATGTNKFTDVASDAYYYDAVLWAVSNNVTNGTSDTTFSPDAPCTRGQVVTFMWRAAGKPAAPAKNVFTDVASDAFYYDAVLWAVDAGITTGMSETTFGPGASCTRGHIVTFLYRYFGKELKIIKQPADYSGYDGDTCTASVTVTGGKAPYKYTWQVHEDTSWIDLSSSNFKFADNTMTVTIKSSSSATYGTLRCIITDAEGKTVTTDEFEGHLLANAPEKDAFGMYVEDVYNISGRGLVFTGRVLSGSIKLGDKLTFRYNDDRGIPVITSVLVEGIEMFHKSLPDARAGDNVGILIGYPWGKDDEGKPRKDTGIEHGIYLFNADESDPKFLSGTYVGTFKMAPSSETGYEKAIDKDTVLNFYANFMDTNSKFINLGDATITPGSTVENLELNFDRARVLFVGDELTVRLGGKTLGTFTVEQVIYH